MAQILTASTYPAQVAVADQWLQQMRAQGYGAPDQIAAGADQQGDWDPSVKALTAFPDVLDLLNHDLDWTTALGDAYYNQPQDVMQTVQVLRDRAQQAGNLQTTPQEDVTQNQGYIDIAPPNPEVVYVPTYDPWDVYGAPIAPYPGFSLVGALGSFFGGLPIQYGLSFALGAFDRMPFGMLSWGLDWMGHNVLFHHSGYFTASASVRDWGLPRGGPRAYNGAYSGWRQNARAPGGYGNGGYGNPGRRYPTPQNSYQNSYQRGGAYGNRAPAQNYARQPEPNREPARPDAYSYRGAQQPGYGNTHPALPAQNYAYHPQTYPNRAQTYSIPPTQIGRSPSAIPATAMPTGPRRRITRRGPDTRMAMDMATGTAIRIRPIARRRRIRAPIPAARMSPMAIPWRAMSPAVFVDSAARSNRSSARQNTKPQGTPAAAAISVRPRLPG